MRKVMVLTPSGANATGNLTDDAWATLRQQFAEEGRQRLEVEIVGGTFLLNMANVIGLYAEPVKEGPKLVMPEGNA